MPTSAIDAISPAFQHTKQQLFEPFRFAQWAKLALVGLLAGELSSGGCNTGNFQVPTPSPGGGAHRLLDPTFPKIDPAALGAMVVLLVLAGCVLGILLLYVNSVMRFVLFDSVVAKKCEIGRSWNTRQKPGFRYFLWHLLFLFATIAGIVILVGVPAALAFAAGWLKQPKQHIAPLILLGMLVFFVFLAFIILTMVVQVLTKDFVVPQMALDDIGPLQAWKRLLPQIGNEKGGYAGYLGMKIVMALGAAVVIGIVTTIIILVLLIPVGGIGAIAVLGGKAAGLTWNAYTITLAVVVGCLVLAVLLYVVALVSVPAIVFFPAYSIYFFAARYPKLQAVLHPALPAPPLIFPQPSMPGPPPEGTPI